MKNNPNLFILCGVFVFIAQLLVTLVTGYFKNFYTQKYTSIQKQVKIEQNRNIDLSSLQTDDSIYKKYIETRGYKKINRVITN